MVSEDNMDKTGVLCVQFCRNVDQAVENYSNNNVGSQIKTSSGSFNSTRARQFYDSLKPSNSTNWDDESIFKFFENIQVDFETDIVVFLILKSMEVESLEEVKFSEFERGCKANGCDDNKSWLAAIPKMRQQLQSQAKLKEVYKSAFGFNLEPGKKNLPIEDANKLWDLFIPESTCKFMPKWKTFLACKKDKGELIVITRDNWDLFWDLNEQT